MSKKCTNVQVRGLHPNAGVEWVEAGIDWLSFTFKGSDPYCQVMQDKWQNYLLEHVLPDNKGVQWAMNGYHGFKVAGCFTGIRDDGCYIQLTGAHANEGFDAVYHPNVHVSRLDVQFTIKYTEEHTNVATNAYRAIERLNRTLPITKRRTPQHIRKPNGADTLYCGSRASEHYGRLYNKAHQNRDEHYQRAWRYETVYKNDLATRIASETPQDREKRARWAFNGTLAWWESYGVKPHLLRYRPRVTIPRVEVIPTDVAKRLKWLERQVKPAIEWLTAQGYGDNVLEALGISSEEFQL